MIKQILVFGAIVVGCFASTNADGAETFRAVSPDGLNALMLEIGEGGMSYSVSRRGKNLLGPAPISLVTKEYGRMDAKGVQPKAVARKVTGSLATPLYKKSAIDLSANETRVDFGKWALVLHARNDAVAWRFEIGRASCRERVCLSV